MGIVKEDWTNAATVRCNCGCGEIQFTSWKEEDEYPYGYLSYNLPAFYAYQRPWLERFKEGMKIIWAVISNKQYRLFEVTLFENDNEQIRNFKEFAERIPEIKEDIERK